LTRGNTHFRKFSETHAAQDVMTATRPHLAWIEHAQLAPSYAVEAKLNQDVTPKLAFRLLLLTSQGG
jgi:hypothetical protein